MQCLAFVVFVFFLWYFYVGMDINDATGTIDLTIFGVIYICSHRNTAGPVMQSPISVMNLLLRPAYSRGSAFNGILCSLYMFWVRF